MVTKLNREVSRRFFIFQIANQNKMKTYNNLWETFISKENFELAYKNAIKGKKKQRQVRIFSRNEAENLEKVRQSVIHGDFHTAQYRKMTIYEPKERIIYKLPFAPDRIVQHAVMNILKPILLNLFIVDTYACIEGRGQHKAGLKCSDYVRRNKYCYQGDVRKFYPSIDQNILSGMFHRIIKDMRFLVILDDIIFSFEGGKNCPIGNYCSQWFGNYYLSKLDNFVKHELKCKDYERFCDDFLLFSDDKTYLNYCKRRIEDFLKSELLLSMSKSDIFCTEQGVDFCGYRYFPKYVLLRKRTAKRIMRRVRKGNVPKQALASLNGVMKHCCSFHLRQKLKTIYTVSSAN